MYGGADVAEEPAATTYNYMRGTGCSSDNLFSNLQVLAASELLLCQPFNDFIKT